MCVVLVYFLTLRISIFEKKSWRVISIDVSTKYVQSDTVGNYPRSKLPFRGILFLASAKTGNQQVTSILVHTLNGVLNLTYVKQEKNSTNQGSSRFYRIQYYLRFFSSHASGDDGCCARFSTMQQRIFVYLSHITLPLLQFEVVFNNLSSTWRHGFGKKVLLLCF